MDWSKKLKETLYLQKLLKGSKEGITLPDIKTMLTPQELEQALEEVSAILDNIRVITEPEEVNKVIGEVVVLTDGHKMKKQYVKMIELNDDWTHGSEYECEVLYWDDLTDTLLVRILSSGVGPSYPFAINLTSGYEGNDSLWESVDNENEPLMKIIGYTR